MSSKFYIISLGPGSPELITMQAFIALQECDIIFVSTRSNGSNAIDSIAYNILEKVFTLYGNCFNNPSNNWKQKLKSFYTSMNYNTDAWNSQAESIIEAFNLNNKIGYVTLGDAGIYSSAYYLLNIIKEKNNHIYQNTEVIAGITSFSYASAKLKKPLCLGDASLKIMPVHSEKTESANVYMRFHKGDNTDELVGNELYYCENLGLENENCQKGIPAVINNYLSLVIDFVPEETQ